LLERYKGRKIPEFKVSKGQSLGPGPGMGGMAISGWDPTQTNLLSVLTKAGRCLNSFAKLKNMLAVFF